MSSGKRTNSAPKTEFLAGVSERMREVLGIQWGDQRSLAAKLGLPEGRLSGYLRRTVHAPLEFYVSVAAYAGCTLDWLLAGKGERGPGGADPGVAADDGTSVTAVRGSSWASVKGSVR